MGLTDKTIRTSSIWVSHSMMRLRSGMQIFVDTLTGKAIKSAKNKMRIMSSEVKRLNQLDLHTRAVRHKCTDFPGIASGAVLTACFFADGVVGHLRRRPFFRSRVVRSLA